mmetsp:Transcript_118770/g.378804  ORF Transcript_118770/g.378804 Transcript_118770/m.378804 type:complete len:92 (-) Transcript_118770:949-1224(-)
MVPRGCPRRSPAHPSGPQLDAVHDDCYRAVSDCGCPCHPLMMLPLRLRQKVVLSFLRLFFSPGPHKWQNLHSTPSLQPFVFTKAQGLHTRN